MSKISGKEKYRTECHNLLCVGKVKRPPKESLKMNLSNQWDHIQVSRATQKKGKTKIILSLQKPLVVIL